jgi:hypothetical protein
MANETYQKINWGWLNDYNGYKFAPYTFINQIFSEDGHLFKQKLESGDFIVGKARKLVNDSDSSLINTSSSKPVYFVNGSPVESIGPLEIDLNGNINNKEDYSGTTLKGENIISDTLTSKNITASGIINGTLNGNASTATKLKNERVIKIGDTENKFDGSKNIEWSYKDLIKSVNISITNGTTGGPKITTTINEVEGNTITIPAATLEKSGVITTANQSFLGKKTF